MYVCGTCGGQMSEFTPVYVVGVGVITAPYEREDGGFVCLSPRCRMSFQLSSTSHGLFILSRIMGLDEYDDFMRGYNQSLQDPGGTDLSFARKNEREPRNLE